jgi:hypothetical protein
MVRRPSSRAVGLMMGHENEQRGNPSSSATSGEYTLIQV